MLPVDFKASELASPIFNYPYVRSREALEAMRRQNEWDSCHVQMRFINPVDGGFAMPTLAAFMQLLPKEMLQDRGLPLHRRDCLRSA